MRRLNRIKLSIFLYIGIISFFSSCVKDEISNISPDKLKSETISFGANVLVSDEITRSGSSRDKIDTRFLKSGEDTTLSLPLGVYQQKGVESIYNSQLTKGSVFTQDLLNSMKVWCTLTTSAELENNNANKNILYIDGENFVKDQNNIFKCSTSYLWPGSGSLTFDVLANVPESATYEYNILNTIKDNYLKSFTYTVPTSVSDQKDIVYSRAVKAGNAEEVVDLSFEHIMAAVNFKVGDIAHGEIKSITLKGVYTTGKYNFNNGQWAILNTDPSHKSNYSVKFNGGSSFTVNDNTQSGTLINDPVDGIFMMIPQIVPEGATIEVVFQAPGANPRTLTASIAGDDWGKDIITNYIISIDEQYNLNITPVGKLLDAHYIIAQVEVTVEGMNDASNVQQRNQWLLTSNVDGVTMLTKNCIAAEESDVNKHYKELQMAEAGFWCDKYVNRNTVNGEYVYTATEKSARGAEQITGSGNVSKELVYIFIPENNSTASREISLTLQKANDPTVTKSVVLTQRCPGWTNDGQYGWETVDDDEDGQYGFTFTRKIAWVYVYSHYIGFGGSLTADFTALNMSKQEVFDYIKRDFIDAYGASSYAKIDDSTRYIYEPGSGIFGYDVRNYRYYIYLDYTILNNLQNVGNELDGFQNTLALNRLGGSASTLAFETILYNAKKTKEGNGDEPTFRPNGWNWGTMTYDESKREKMKDGSLADVPVPEGSINDLSGIISFVLKKNKHYLYDPGDDGISSTVLAPIILDDDIKWYIPAVKQFETFVPNPNITDKNGGVDSPDDYWSSTAAENSTNPADAKSYHGGGYAISRTTELGVIAVRNRDNDTKIINTSTTVDNSSLQGGNNGSTNNWVE